MQISADPPALLARRRRPRETFWNLPNTITLGRIAAVPLLLLLPLLQGPAGSFAMGVGFLAVALTDLLDGYLARRDGTITRIGKLLDPLADKLLVMAALVMLVYVGRIPGWAMPLALVILAREMAVTALRAMASSEGVVIAAERLGKWKSGFQTAALTGLLMHHPVLGLPIREIGLALFLIAAVLTLWSGYEYFSAYLGSRQDEA